MFVDLSKASDSLEQTLFLGRLSDVGLCSGASLRIYLIVFIQIDTSQVFWTVPHGYILDPCFFLFLKTQFKRIDLLLKCSFMQMTPYFALSQDIAFCLLQASLCGLKVVHNAKKTHNCVFYNPVYWPSLILKLGTKSLRALL